jgi:hemin uptake protein HemP
LANRADAESASPERPAELLSEVLLGGSREVTIRHGVELYRLRLTRMNKLILTK